MSTPGFRREPPPSVRAPAARRWRRRALLLALLSATVGCDRVTKSVATALLAEGRRISLLGDSIRLERIHNPGAFLGLGADLGEAARAALVADVALVAGVVLLAWPASPGRADDPGAPQGDRRRHRAAT